MNMVRGSTRAGLLAVIVLVVMVIVVVAGPPPVRPGRVVAAAAATVRNQDGLGQVVRLDIDGNAIDAHDGEIKLFEGRYHLYGTAYQCGWQYLLYSGPACGFKSYSSTDLVHWRYDGPLFDLNGSDAMGRDWLTNVCSSGCYRPHVLYNPAGHQYVLWINALNVEAGYEVLTAPGPAGPFTSQPQPRLSQMGGNNGDQNLFVDDDGTGYIIYTHYLPTYHLWLERLTPDFLSGAGGASQLPISSVEAPALFKHAGRYYVTYSDPGCSFCAGTGTSVVSTGSLSQPVWSAPISLSSDSCSGQPSHVAQLDTPDGHLDLYLSDRWNGLYNEANGNLHWEPLSFGPDGTPDPIACLASWSAPTPLGPPDLPAPVAGLDHDAGLDGYHHACPVEAGRSLLQTFSTNRTGALTVGLNLYQQLTAVADPVDPTITRWLPVTAPVTLSLVAMAAPGGVLASRSLQPLPLSRSSIPRADLVDWQSRRFQWDTGVVAVAGTVYGIQVATTSAHGCYGVEIGDASLNPLPSGRLSYVGKAGADQPGRQLRLDLLVQGGGTPAPSPDPPGPTPTPAASPSPPGPAPPPRPQPVGGAFHPISPVRLLDTRLAGGRLGPGESRRVDASGLAPPGAGLVLNLTEASATTSGYISLRPGDGAAQLTSALNFDSRGPVANLAMVRLGAGDGSFWISNQAGWVDLAIDVMGWIGGPAAAGGASFHTMPQTRAYDSRQGAARLSPGVALVVDPRLPPEAAGVTAVLINLTAVTPAGPGWLAAFPERWPGTSNLNYLGGDIVANHALVPVGADGRIRLASYAPTDVVVDVEGWFGAADGGQGATLVDPYRMADTRISGPADRHLITVQTGAPAAARAVIVNLTVVDATAPGYLTAFPGPSVPPVSDLNYAAGPRAVAGLAIVGLDPRGGFAVLTSSGNPQIVSDFYGWLG